MDRRSFIKATLAAGLLSAVEAQAMDEKMKQNSDGIERRTLGATGEKLSILGFGGIIVMNATPEESAHHVAEAFDRGINYFDVAPSYGNAVERLGPALKPYRDRVFLACKTGERKAEGAERELNATLKTMQTDHFDLFQLHGLTKVEEVETAFGPGGAMEVFTKARQAGKIRYIGFSAHSEEAAMEAMRRFRFDTILFPFNFATWMKGEFGPRIYRHARELGMGVLALKAMAHGKWPEKLKPEERTWQKAWYEPLDKKRQAELALRFTLGLPVDAAIPPGHWELFQMAMATVQAGPLKPLDVAEEDELRSLAGKSDPIFSAV